jgi:hypothetical protein
MPRTLSLTRLSLTNGWAGAFFMVRYAPELRAWCAENED